MPWGLWILNCKSYNHIFHGCFDFFERKKMHHHKQSLSNMSSHYLTTNLDYELHLNRIEELIFKVQWWCKLHGKAFTAYTVLNISIDF